MRFILDTLLKAAVRLVPLFAIFILPKYRLIFAGVYVVVLGVSEYISVAQPEKRLRERTQRILDSHFRPWVTGAKYEKRKPSIRVNVMLVNTRRLAVYRVLRRANEYLTTRGLNVALGRLRMPLSRPWITAWLEPKFVQVYEHGMSGWPDANLSLPVETGFVGECFPKNTKNTYYKDMRGKTFEELNAIQKLTQKEFELTKHITAITCTTLMRKKKRIYGRRLPEEEYFGVLNIDATDNDGANYLSQKKVLEAVRSFGVVVEEIYA